MKSELFMSEEYGFVDIQDCKPDFGKYKGKIAFIVWLDPEETGAEGYYFGEDEERDEWYEKTFFEGIDFSDKPENGHFETFDQAKLYIESKIGNLKEHY